MELMNNSFNAVLATAGSTLGCFKRVNFNFTFFVNTGTHVGGEVAYAVRPLFSGLSVAGTICGTFKFNCAFTTVTFINNGFHDYAFVRKTFSSHFCTFECVYSCILFSHVAPPVWQVACEQALFYLLNIFAWKSTNPYAVLPYVVKEKTVFGFQKKCFLALLKSPQGPFYGLFSFPGNSFYIQSRNFSVLV